MEQCLLEQEAYILCYLKSCKNISYNNISHIDGIPAVKSYGYSGEFNILVMELLGKSLEDLFQLQKKKFSVKTVCLIALQILDRIEFVHNKNIIHRDIKPDNFVVGLDNKSHIIYILDFGLSKKYRSSRTKSHIPFIRNKKLTGTARYASINALDGCEQSRRDDLEAIGYVLMYFLRGSLPWQGLKLKTGENRYKKILEVKSKFKIEELCKDFPNEFAEYINYTRKLHFEENPDYKKLRLLFIGLLNKMNCEYDFFFDWLKEKPKINPDEGKRYMTKDGSINLEYGKDNNKKIEKKETNSSTVSGNSRKEDKEINVNHDPIVNTLPNEDDNNNNNKKNRNKNNLKSYANQIVNTNSAILNEPLNVDINDNNDNNDKVKNNNKDKKTDQDECIIF